MTGFGACAITRGDAIAAESPSSAALRVIVPPCPVRFITEPPDLFGDHVHYERRRLDIVRPRNTVRQGTCEGARPSPLEHHPHLVALRHQPRAVSRARLRDFAERLGLVGKAAQERLVAVIVP